MDMPTRRTICAQALEWLTSDDLEQVVDEVVSHYSKEKLNVLKLEPEDEDEG